MPNGILLCAGHHAFLHAHPDRQIRLVKNEPYLVPATWIGDPLPIHRMQHHPITMVKRMKTDGFDPPQRS